MGGRQTSSEPHLAHSSQELLFAYGEAGSRSDHRINTAVGTQARPVVVHPLLDGINGERLAAMEASTYLTLLKFLPMIGGMFVSGVGVCE